MNDRSVAVIARAISSADVADLPRLLRKHASDERAGVARAVAVARTRLERHLAEEARLDALQQIQRDLHDQGLAIVAGVDEVGRGALAGPVSAAAVVLPVDVRIPGLDDSKRIPAARRRDVAEHVRAVCVAFSVAHVPPAVIDSLGIAGATRQAMIEALASLGVMCDHVVVDGLPVDLGLPSTAIVGGDGRCGAIAAASVLAKVARDELMASLDADYPGYGFAQHKGYGCAEHVDSIRRLGPSAAHRLSFAPCAQASLF